MGVKRYKPTSDGIRWKTGYTFEEITRHKPEKSLVTSLKRKSGRSNQGKVSVRHRGGGAKQNLRVIDFKRNKIGIPGRVAAIEILIMNAAVRNLIREGKTFQIPNVMQMGSQYGSQTMDQALKSLVDHRLANLEDALTNRTWLNYL